MFFKIISLITVTLLASMNVFAQEDIRTIETIIPFASEIKSQFKDNVVVDRTTNQSFVHLRVNSSLIPELSKKFHQLTRSCGGFVDVTDEKPLTDSHREAIRRRFYTRVPMPKIEKNNHIAEAIDRVEAKNIENFAKLFSSRFKSRVATSEEGHNAAVWLQTIWLKMAIDAHRDDIKVELMDFPKNYKQSSVRITIPGRNLSLPIVVLGAHLDSINMYGSHYPAPGADDDGSGIAALTEAYYALLKDGYRPNATVQIFGYAAEELGLLGSRGIAEYYSTQSARVRGVFQLDMVAYPGKNRAVTFITDNVNPELTNWTKDLYKAYLPGPIQDTRCGYACSDHASWTRYGFPAVFPFESSFRDYNQKIHSQGDIWDQSLDADYSALFSKLAVAWTMTLAE